jgi:hypothetical protein
MPMTTPRSPGPLALVFRLSVAATLALFAGCESTPCEGDGCIDACNGAPCGDDASLPPPPVSAGPGRFTECRSDASCDEGSGFECVDGTCLHACRSHFDCGGVARCESSRGRSAYCALTDPPTEPGGYYSNCPDGVCARGFGCVGSGIGDTDSYCTANCAGDGDCPAGYFCGVVATSEGGEQSVCTPRGFCAECERDADCLSVPGGVCARDASGEKRCTALCDPARPSCPWGAATECRVTDSELGVPTCQHRSGACRGQGAGCDACWRDEDCPNGYCLVSSYTGESWCIDQMLPCTCSELSKILDFCDGESTGCPDSPSGMPMVCYDPGSAGGGVCVGVNLPGSSSGSRQLSCWR